MTSNVSGRLRDVLEHDARLSPGEESLQRQPPQGGAGGCGVATGRVKYYLSFNTVVYIFFA